jgi:hypothetical protein
MKTTPRGIPYLENSDPMDQVPLIIQALAETVDQLLTAKQNGEG